MKYLLVYFDENKKCFAGMPYETDILPSEIGERKTICVAIPIDEKVYSVDLSNPSVSVPSSYQIIPYPHLDGKNYDWEMLEDFIHVYNNSGGYVYGYSGVGEAYKNENEYLKIMGKYE